MEPGDKMGFPPGIAESMVILLTYLSLGLLLLQKVSGAAFQEVPAQT
jgi:hypothetical protein